VNPSEQKRRLIKLIRVYPLIALLVLSLAFFLGAFTPQAHPLIPQGTVITLLYLFIGLGPLTVIVGLIAVGVAGDRERTRGARNQDRLAYGDPFELPNEDMAGYKVASITGKYPTLTGLTGDNYLADDVARCSVDTSHVPPVAGCECGFHAFKNIKDAKFESSINPGVFLLEVELFGVGFEYDRGFRAEAQLVTQLIIPRRCMRCKTFSAERFVKNFHLGYRDETWWQWSARCKMCSLTFKEEDRLTFDQMSQELQVTFSHKKKIGITDKPANQYSSDHI
jgi:hypothetical protein